MQIIATWGKKGPGETHFEKSLTSEGVFRYLCEGWSASGREGESFFIDSERPLERTEVERRFANF